MEMRRHDLAQLTLTSWGRLILAPITQAFIERSTGVSKCTTCPQACTPASVRPAHSSDTASRRLSTRLFEGFLHREHAGQLALPAAIARAFVFNAQCDR
jgi:hypothetical protein